MSRAVKAPVWKRMRVGDTWHKRTIYRARVSGWAIDVQGRRLTADSEQWWFYANHRNGEDAFNSAWDSWGLHYASRDLAQAAAEKGAREGWESLRVLTS